MSNTTTFVHRKGAKARPAQPYVVEREPEVFDFGCRTCRVLVAGVRGRGTAQAWADTHRCEESWADRRRPWP